MLNNKTILITGGTGSFGQKCTEIILQKYEPKKLIIFSRDEFKQSEMQKCFNDKEYPCMRYFIGDIRDEKRLHRAFSGVDYIIHAAALKQVPSAEYNPSEAIQTNVIGAMNIIDAAIDCKVKKVLSLSTDKAVNPTNLYGATKLCMEKLMISGNSYSTPGNTIFSAVRYGNVVGSRGSVIPLFNNLKTTKELPITHLDMTRFWITLEQSVNFILDKLEVMEGGEIFVPKIPVAKITDIAEAICPDCKFKVIGIRSGEKIHETLISSHESKNVKEYMNFFVILPEFKFWSVTNKWNEGKNQTNEFEYSSNKSFNKILTQNEILEMIT